MERRRRWHLRAVICPPDQATEKRGAGRWTHLVPIAVAMAFAAGCGSFFGSPEPSGLGSNGIKNACTWATVKDDCLADEFCEATDCKAVGNCVPRPSPFMSGDL